MAKENTKAETEAAKEDLEEIVEAMLPLTFTDEDSYPYPIYVNSKRYLIKRGETVMVPRYVKKLIDDHSRAKLNARKYAEAHSLEASDAEFRRRYNLG